MVNSLYLTTIIIDSKSFFSAVGGVVDKLNIGSVAYSICFHSRLKQVIFGIPEGKIIPLEDLIHSINHQVFNFINMN